MTTYGKNLKISIYGGSHDEKIGVIVEGMPKGVKINAEELQRFMSRRAPGQSLSTPRKETDTPVFLSGVENGVTDSSTLEIAIYNKNMHSSDYDSLKNIPRPSHADFAAIKKYNGNVDLRGGGHFSGRLTAPMCAIGGICLQILRERYGIEISAHVYSIADINDTPFDPTNVSISDFEALRSSHFPVLDEQKGELMRERIAQARDELDSVGGVVECAILGLPIGLGEHMFDGVEGRISQIVFSIPAVKGLEFGLGFGSSRLRGSQNNDPFYFDTDTNTVKTKTNNCGGILGGMTNGMPVVFRAAMKPTPSIAREQDSVNLATGENVKLSIKGRHDPCVVVRAVPVFEAAAAIAVFDMLCD